MKKGILSRLRAFINIRIRSYERASITIEAAFSLSIFIFCIVILLAPIISIKQHLHTTKVLEEKARLISRLKYAEYYLAHSDKISLDSSVLEGGETAMSIASAYMDIDTTGLLYADFLTESHIDDTEIQLVLNYSVNIPFPFMHISDYSKQVVAYRRAWVGDSSDRFSGNSTGGTDGEEDTIVYVGRSSTDKYHSKASCSYLRSSYQSSPVTSMDTIRNSFGQRYHACHSCHPSETSGTVYYTQGGSAYHSSTSCPSMQAYPYTMTLTQALSEGRTLCHRCPPIE